MKISLDSKGRRTGQVNMKAKTGFPSAAILHSKIAQKISCGAQKCFDEETGRL